jgi:Family of unknown function (DUF5681)
MSVEKPPSAVGYKQPPAHSQFRPGRSGNPRGRPKRQPSLHEDLALELAGTIRVNEDGKPKLVTKQRAMIMAIVAAAVAGEMRAVTAVIGLRARQEQTDSGSKASTPEGNAELLETFIAREITRRENHKNPQENDNEENQEIQE